MIEVNPRASRTVPFVAKVIGAPVARIAARVMAGEALAGIAPPPFAHGHVGVKEAVFPFARFPNVDTLLGPEMRSTGEVLGLGRDFPTAFVRAQLGAGSVLPATGTVFVSVRDADKERIVEPMRALKALGFTLLATSGTRRYLEERGVACTHVNKVLEGRPHIVDAMKNGQVQLVLNTTEGAQAIADSRSLRRNALMHRIPYYTTLAGALAAARGIEAGAARHLEVTSLQDYLRPAGVLAP